MTNKVNPIIAHLVGSFNVGGTARHIFAIIKNTRDFDHIIMCPRNAEINISLVKSVGVPVLQGNIDRLLKKNKPDILHIHHWGAGTPIPLDRSLAHV